MVLYFYSSEMIIREMEKHEIPLLEEFLYQAIFIPEGKEKPGREILKLTEIQVYINDFGKETDHCLVACKEDLVIGAVWSRQFPENEKGFGFVDSDTPEIAMSVLQSYRKQGVGTLLLKAMLDRLARNGYRQVSLSVDVLNYAYKMYQKAGFINLGPSGESVTMIKKLFEKITQQIDMKISWITIYVRDMEESLQFYTQILGLEVKRTFSAGPGMEICFMEGNGTDLELICNTEHKDVAYGQDISVGFTVESLDDTIAYLKEKGITRIIGPVSPNPVIRFIFIFDPNGLKIQLAEQKIS